MGAEDNCSDDDMDLQLPLTDDFFDELYVHEEVFVGLSGALVVINWIIFIKVLLHIMKSMAEVRRIRITSTWIIALTPILAISSFMSLVIPRTFLLKEVLNTGCLAVVVYKFIQHIKACMTHMGFTEYDIDKPVSFQVAPLCCLCRCLPTKQATPKLIKTLKALCMQYSYVGIVTTVLMMALWLDERYEVGDNSSSTTYTILQGFKVISTMTAMFSLNVYYTFTVEATSDFYIREKHVGFQLTILFVNIQDVLFAILTAAGVFGGDRGCIPEVVFSNFYQDFVFSIEMLLVSLLNLRAFTMPVNASAESRRSSETSSALTGQRNGRRGHRADSGVAPYYGGEPNYTSSDPGNKNPAVISGGNAYRAP